MTMIENDKIVLVHYKGTFPESGEVFDTSEGGEPLGYLVGHQNMIPGFEREMMGAASGEKREFTLMAEDAYGEQTEEAIIEIPSTEFPPDLAVELGMTLESAMGRFRVVALTDAYIKCDFNHPLAGRALKFEVEVVEIRDATEEEIAHGHAHGGDGHHH